MGCRKLRETRELQISCVPLQASWEMGNRFEYETDQQDQRDVQLTFIILLCTSPLRSTW